MLPRRTSVACVSRSLTFAGEGDRATRVVFVFSMRELCGNSRKTTNPPQRFVGTAVFLLLRSFRERSHWMSQPVLAFRCNLYGAGTQRQRQYDSRFAGRIRDYGATR